MTTPNEQYAQRAHDALTALIDTLILAPLTDPDAPIDSTDLIDDILNAQPHDLLHNAICDLAFDALDLDDDMLTDLIQNRIDTLIMPF
jgi:hypothetical protein